MNNCSEPTSVVFFGTPEFAVVGLRALLSSPQYVVKLVITQPDRAAGRGKKLSPSPVKQVAMELGLPVLQPPSIKKQLPDFLAALEKYAPFDIGVVIAFGQILPQPVLDFPKGGCVNVHASLLPRWRGAAPIHRAIISGDTETGVCLMKMEAGLDTGPVFSKASTPIKETDTTKSLHDNLARIGAALLVQDLQRIALRDLSAEPQSPDGVTYAQKISNDESRIDWSKNSLDIARLAHGLNPAPGAYTTFRGQRLKILKATSVACEPSGAPPGTVTRVFNNNLEIQCGQGVLALEELQLEGKKRLGVEEFLRGTSIQKDERLI